MPLTYREYVYLVPASTSEADAERFLRTKLEALRAALAPVKTGKLVNLAAFEVAFQGKPPTPPLATLAWKDWRGDPVVGFPRRVPPPPSPAPVAPVSSVVAGLAPALAPVPVPVSVAVAVPIVAPVAVAAPPAPVAVPALAPVEMAPPRKSVPPPPPVRAPEVYVSPLAPLPVAEPAVPAAEPPVVVASESAAPAAVAPEPAPALAPEPEPSPPPAPEPSPTQTPAEPPKQAAAPETSVAPAPRARLRSEDLMADLFEAMHDLHFARDALEGGEFCLALAMEKVPARVGIIHLYDIDRREFVVTTTRGAGTGKLLSRRHPESDPVLIGAMRKRRAIVFADASQSDAPSVARYADLGGIFSLIVAPVMQAGRFLGAIELVDPLDGRPFSELEGAAIFYIAEQYAELVGKLGVVVDPEAVAARALPEA